MEKADAVVVGPAGSTCARELVRHGLDMLVVDRAGFPRDKPCAGWITPPVVDALGLDLGGYGRDHTLQPITGFRTGVVGGRTREVAYPEAVSYGILRCELDDYLLRRASRAGAGGARARLRGRPLAP